jgi:hypothetical protein
MASQFVVLTTEPDSEGGMVYRLLHILPLSAPIQVGGEVIVPTPTTTLGEYAPGKPITDLLSPPAITGLDTGTHVWHEENTFRKKGESALDALDRATKVHEGLKNLVPAEFEQRYSVTGYTKTIP